MASNAIISHGRNERFRKYTLFELLPEGHCLVLDMVKGIMTQISDEPTVVEQQLIAMEEMVLIAELLSAFPYHAPDAVLLAAKTQRDLKECQKEVKWAYENGTWDQVLRPVRGTISRCRVKLHPFGIDARSIVQTSYILMPLEKVKR